ncbi:MAG: hypothetical protein QY307_08575 [Acidimicrobiia bacterium]|nr:MAG: hypothetical protein QY307_08575 [Acidimicrobiia bacterium]
MTRPRAGVIIGAIILSLSIAACGGDAADTTTTAPPATTLPPVSTVPTTTLPDGSVIAVFETPDGETYRVLLTGTAAEQARQAFAAGERPGIPNGVIQPGDGGVNTGHDWHVIEVEFADFTIEVCDGTVSYVDDLGYEEFVSQHGDRFCPWAAELVDLIGD